MVIFALALAHGSTPDLDLIEAAQRCDVAGMERAIEAGADLGGEAWIRPHRRSFFRPRPRGRYTTGLHQATRCALAGKAGPLDLLLPAGAPVDVATTDEAPSLHLALEAAAAGEPGAPAVAERLVEAGARPWATYRGRLPVDALYDEDGGSSEAVAAAEAVLQAAGVPAAELLCGAARAGDGAAVARSEADRNGTCRGGSPLIVAATAGQEGVVSQLIAEGARIDGTSRRLVHDGWTTPLHAAVAAEQPDVIAALLEAGASPDAPAGPVWAPADRPMQVALAAPSPELAEQLIAGGASRAVWLPPEEEGGPWRTVFNPGWNDLRDLRPLDREEEAVAYVRGRMLALDAVPYDPAWEDTFGPQAPGEETHELGEDDDHWERALQVWGPVALSALWAQGGGEGLVPHDLDPLACGDLGDPKTLRAAWGRPDTKEGGRWAQRWGWDGAEAVVIRERFPGGWTVARRTGSAEDPCQALVGRPSAEALLRLGPPDDVAVDRLRWRRSYGRLDLELALTPDGEVAGWFLVDRYGGR